MDLINAPSNFTWQLAGLLATGGKPQTPAQVDWLVRQGFEMVISLEEMPDECASLLQSHFVWLLIDLDFYGDGEEFDLDQLPEKVWQEIVDFLDISLRCRAKIYVHCSAGITRSPRMMRRYLYLRKNTTAPAQC